MQMNDIIDGLNTCEYPSSLAGAGCGCNNLQGFGAGGGCGFGSWIWILLILFYTNNQNGYRQGNCCRKRDNCCCDGNSRSGCTSGAGGYLFLLVILFLCGGCGGCGGADYGCGYDGCFDALGGCC